MSSIISYSRCGSVAMILLLLDCPTPLAAVVEGVGVLGVLAANDPMGVHVAAVRQGTHGVEPVDLDA